MSFLFSFLIHLIVFFCLCLLWFVFLHFEKELKSHHHHKISLIESPQFVFLHPSVFFWVFVFVLFLCAGIGIYLLSFRLKKKEEKTVLYHATVSQ